ncbi:hypothetical protein DMI62_20955 [Escherichia coli]|nr:hypothetical protein [Escherichia coli]
MRQTRNGFGLPVTNNDPASVYLIQSWIENAGDQKTIQFVIISTAFPCKVKENTLRMKSTPLIISYQSDRESLFQ